MKDTDREAVATAVQRVAGMLQRPDQLDKVEQYRRREARKKASVEARLKAAIQSQLDGVRTGLSQLHSALGDVKDIQRSLAAVSTDWRRSISTVESLRGVKDAVVRHSQLAAAVENLKSIFSVPEIVRETQGLIEQGALLQAHRRLMDLECSRDGLMCEQFRMDSGNTRDMALIHSYFGSTQALSDELAKQLWVVLQRALVTVRRDPTLLVSVVRIIEREEKIDRRILDRKKQTGFVPPGRPKSWKEKMFAVLDKTVTTRIEGAQADTRESDKMWLVRHLEIVRKYVLDDLVVAKTLLAQCFPPHYEILAALLRMYQQALRARMQELAAEDLEASEIVSLLTWVLNTYTRYCPLPRPAPACWEAGFSPTCGPRGARQAAGLCAPGADQDGFYQTTLPAIVFQMFEQNLQVAAQISEDLKAKVLVLCLQQMNSFLSRSVCPGVPVWRCLKRKRHLGSGEDAGGHCDTIVAVAEVIKLTDPSLLYLEVSTLVSKYPDIRDDHIGALLAVRGDTNRDMKQTILESLEQGPAQASPDYVPLFKDITVPSLNVAKLLK
ncbi:PREDICTED: exocyst complex component 3 [Condylura cristata]|uniref:exocyst complex component 3 n=1 Tax=Condylura cristata TaxID=143302 RepID=UPI00064397E6|nr:PREDICTED: exocyst complex component 3 [Condylura cristata]